ncbi:hypothetical protein AB0T83_17910 [Fluviibacterium sp. DFM31]|uniref:Uncharacterized protein n=1 Tax=Meridianimarinicoccus marinus TaxID=3231483 RepID=A0ABV3LC33_9RHOB
MISPPGYTSLAELWREFCETHFVTVYQMACAQYADDTFNASYCSGSPLDLCEQLFLGTFEDGRISLASGAEHVVDLTPKLDNRRIRFFTTASPFESSNIANTSEEVGPDGEHLMRIGSSQFQAWPHRHGTAEPWRQAYKRPGPDEIGSLRREDVPYHTLPYTFERQRFVIPRTMPGWAEHTFHRYDLDVVFSDHTGSTICLNDGALPKWYAKNIRGRKFLDDFLGTADSTASTGRPQKQEAIWKTFTALYPEGRTGSWKEVTAAVRTASGLDCSQKTVQRAIKTYGADLAKSTTKLEKY